MDIVPFSEHVSDPWKKNCKISEKSIRNFFKNSKYTIL